MMCLVKDINLFVGIDDTDNLETRGTGYRARQLGKLLSDLDTVCVQRITRHQLLVDPRIPYTSHNSSACLTLSAALRQFEAILARCRDYLISESAPGADAGLCVATAEQACPELLDFGQLAKVEVIRQEDACDLADRLGIYLESLTGTGGGVIGALAAAGLCAGGNDGRFLWLPGLRELQGCYTVGELRQSAGIEIVCSLGGAPLPDREQITLGAWNRPILQGGRSVLYVERVESDTPGLWQVLPKERIKALSE